MYLLFSKHSLRLHVNMFIKLQLNLCLAGQISKRTTTANYYNYYYLLLIIISFKKLVVIIHISLTTNVSAIQER